jgi:hypothetical protein
LNQSRSLVPIKIAIFVAFFTFIGLIVSFAGGNDEEDFIALFDGETLNGWHLMNGAKFSAENGIIKLNGGQGWLRSDKEYSNFILRLEFRFQMPEQDGGVFLRSSLDGDNWPDNNYEVQVENTRRMAMIWHAKYVLNADLVQFVLKPVGDWNEYEIHLKGSRLEVRLNGMLVTTSDDMQELTSGYIGLQGENGFHEYRNIRIKGLTN